MQRIVEPLLPTVEAHPELRLILGHAAMVEVLEAARAFEDNPNVLFETSVVQAKDLYVLFRSVDPAGSASDRTSPTATCPRRFTPSWPRPNRWRAGRGHTWQSSPGNIRRWFP